MFRARWQLSFDAWGSGIYSFLTKLFFQYQKQHKTILNQYFSNTIPIQKQFKTILNQDFANTIPVYAKQYRTISNQYFSNPIPIQKAIFSKTKKQHKTMLTQYFSNTKR